MVNHSRMFSTIATVNFLFKEQPYSKPTHDKQSNNFTDWSPHDVSTPENAYPLTVYSLNSWQPALMELNTGF